MAIKRKYLVGQKMSDAKFEEILLAYACAVPATTFIRWSRLNMRQPPSPKTVFTVYTLVRRRLLELNMFPDPNRYFEFWRRDDNRHSFDQSGMPERINFILQQHRTIRLPTFYPILAEVIFRAEYMYGMEEKMLRSIKEVVKITGPLNRPPVNLDVWHQWNSIRTDERRQTETRQAKLPLRPGKTEESIQDKIKVLKRMLRQGHRLKARRAPRRRPKTPQIQSNVTEDGDNGNA